MATGAGKTTVMAMIVTWQVLNALAYPQCNKDFSRAIFNGRARPDGARAPMTCLPFLPLSLFF